VVTLSLLIHQVDVIRRRIALLKTRFVWKVNVLRRVDVPVMNSAPRVFHVSLMEPVKQKLSVNKMVIAVPRPWPHVSKFVKTTPVSVLNAKMTTSKAVTWAVIRDSKRV
jgi:hypothetical protein